MANPVSIKPAQNPHISVSSLPLTAKCWNSVSNSHSLLRHTVHLGMIVSTLLAITFILDITVMKLYNKILQNRINPNPPVNKTDKKIQSLALPIIGSVGALLASVALGNFLLLGGSAVALTALVMSAPPAAVTLSPPITAIFWQAMNFFLQLHPFAQVTLGTSGGLLSLWGLQKMVSSLFFQRPRPQQDFKNLSLKFIETNAKFIPLRNLHPLTYTNFLAEIVDYLHRALDPKKKVPITDHDFIFQRQKISLFSLYDPLNKIFTQEKINQLYDDLEQELNSLQENGKFSKITPLRQRIFDIVSNQPDFQQILNQNPPLGLRNGNEVNCWANTFAHIFDLPCGKQIFDTIKDNSPLKTFGILYLFDKWLGLKISCADSEIIRETLFPHTKDKNTQEDATEALQLLQNYMKEKNNPFAAKIEVTQHLKQNDENESPLLEPEGGWNRSKSEDHLLPQIEIIPHENLSLQNLLNNYFDHHPQDPFLQLKPNGENYELIYSVERITRLITSKPPPMIIIRVNKNQFQGGTSTKNSQSIEEILPTLNFSPGQCPHISNTEYELVYSINHQGSSANHGHYDAYIKQNDRWYRCNDSNIEEIKDDDIKNLTSQLSDTYLLAYVRKP